jgi:hypothetical protein
MFERKWANLILCKAYFAVVDGCYNKTYNATENKICRLESNDETLNIL